MRILVLSFYFPPDLGPGPVRAGALVDALREVGGAGVHVDVLTSMPNRYRTLRQDAQPFEEHAGLTVTRIQLPDHRSGMVDQSKAYLTFARRVRREVKGRRWDVVVASSSRLMTAVLGTWVAKRSGASCYLDIRDLFADTLGDVLNRSASRGLVPAFRVLERRTVRSAARVNVVSAGFLPYMRAIEPDHAYRVFTNGIDPDFRLPLPPERSARRDPREDGGLPLIVYAGNIGEGQGLHRIVPQVAGQLADTVRFRLLGDGGRRGRLEEEIDRSGVRNVEILDPVPRQALLAQYREARVLFLHLNDFDAFRKVLPSKIFEYAATGKPILAGVAGFSAEFLRSEVPGVEVFDPCDAAGMVRALETLLEGPEYFARESFCDRYDRGRIMREMAADVLALGGPDGP